MEEKIKKELKNPEEGSLIWDEYKYRHDLIWKHLIRSTVAVFTYNFPHNAEKAFVDKYEAYRKELEIEGSLK